MRVYPLTAYWTCLAVIGEFPP